MKLQVNWFDIFVAIVLVIGFFRGRKRGMSMELLPLFEVLVILVAGAQLYEMLGKKLALASDGALSLLLSYWISYLLFAFVVHIIFTKLRTAVGEKLVGSDIFGSMEYYFGMGAGMLRFGCLLLMFMALMHSLEFDPVKDAQFRKAQMDNFGNALYIPSPGGIRQEIFKKSYVGLGTERFIPHLLLKVTASDAKLTSNREPISKKREAAINDVITGGNSSAKK